jgi:hypothetical protein
MIAIIPEKAQTLDLLEEDFNFLKNTKGRRHICSHDKTNLK